MQKKNPHSLLTPLKYFFLQTCQLHIQYESLTKAFGCIYLQFNLKKNNKMYAIKKSNKKHYLPYSKLWISLKDIKKTIKEELCQTSEVSPIYRAINCFVIDEQGTLWIVNDLTYTWSKTLICYHQSMVASWCLVISNLTLSGVRKYFT